MTGRLLGLWRRLVRATGRAGPPGIALLLAAIALAAATPRLNRELGNEYASLEAQANSLRSGVADSVREPAREDRLANYVGAFPEPQQMARDLAAIFASAERHNVALNKGDYQLKIDRDSPFVAYVASFPVRSDYGPVKAFASDVLQALPHVSLDELKLNRDAADGEGLDAVVRFTLTYRSK